MEQFTTLVAEDVRNQVVDTSCFEPASAGVNLTVVVYAVANGGMELRLDGQLQSVDELTLSSVAACAASFIEGRAFELRRTTAAAGSNLDADCNATWPAAVVISAASLWPCAVRGMVTASSDGGASFPWYYILIGVAGAAAVGWPFGGSSARWPFSTVGVRQPHNDAGKYTLEFLPDGTDEDIQMLSSGALPLWRSTQRARRGGGRHFHLPVA